MPANLNRKQQREIKAVVERAKNDNGIPQTAQQSIPFQRMFPDGIHEMVHAANLNPEQLSELLRMFAADMAPKPDTINTMNEEETQNEI